MKGDYKVIPFSGVNREVLDDQATDGLCEDIINLRPKGDEQNPYWEPVSDYDSLRSSGDHPFPITNISQAFFQILTNRDSGIENYTDAFRRVLTLEGNTLKLYEDQGDWTVVDTYDIGEDDFFTATRIGNLTVITTSKNEVPGSIIYLKDDQFFSSDFPHLPRVELRWYPRIFSESAINSGGTTGIPSKKLEVGAGDEYFLQSMVAYEMFDGTSVKHSPIQLVRIPYSSIDGVYFQPVTYLRGYDQIPDDLDFWKKYIRGVSVYITNIRDTVEDALDESVFYKISEYNDISKFPLSSSNVFDPKNKNYFKDVNIRIDSLSTNEHLGVDNFTNHSRGGVYLDSYNNRLLSGIVNTGFSNPSGLLIKGFDDYSYNVNIIESYGDFTQKIKYAALGFNNASEAELLGPPITSGFDVEQYSDGEALHFSADQVTGKLPDQRSITMIYKKSGVSNSQISVTYDFYSVLHASGNTQIFPSIYDRRAISSAYYVVKIKTDKGDFYRRGELSASEIVSHTSYKSTLVFSYPDSRATELYFFYKSSGDTYYTRRDFLLKSQNTANYSYVVVYDMFDDEFEILDNPASDFDFEQILIEKSEVKASLVNNPFVFDVGATYDISGRQNAIVKGFGVNAIETSEGQFGQYTLYIFTTVGIYALEQGGDPEVAFGRLVPVSPSHVVDSFNSFVNADQVLLFCNDTGVYSLVGRTIQRISDPVFSEGYYTKSFSDGVVMGFNKDTEEIIISNPSFDYSIIYNIDYGRWYKIDKSYKAFFYDYPQLIGVSKDDEVKDFSKQLTGENVPVTLVTRALNLGNPYIKKKLRRSILRGIMAQSAPLDVVTIRLIGYDDRSDAEYELILSKNSKERMNDLTLINRFGSMNSFKLEINGAMKAPDTKLYQLELNYEGRYTHRVRQ